MCVLENADIKEKNNGLPATANGQKKHFDLFTLWRRTVLKNKTKVILIFTRTRPGIQAHMYGVRVSSCWGRQMKIPVSTYVVIYINHWAERFTKLGICRSCLLHYLSISYVHMCIWYARRYVRYKLMISREAFRSFYKFKKKNDTTRCPLSRKRCLLLFRFVRRYRCPFARSRYGIIFRYFFHLSSSSRLVPLRRKHCVPLRLRARRWYKRVPICIHKVIFYSPYDFQPS